MTNRLRKGNLMDKIEEEYHTSAMNHVKNSTKPTPKKYVFSHYIIRSTENIDLTNEPEEVCEIFNRTLEEENEKQRLEITALLTDPGYDCHPYEAFLKHDILILPSAKKEGVLEKSIFYMNVPKKALFLNGQEVKKFGQLKSLMKVIDSYKK